MSKISQEQISTKILENDCNQGSISFLLIKMIRPLSLKKPSLKSDRFFLKFKSVHLIFFLDRLLYNSTYLFHQCNTKTNYEGFYILT